MSQRTYINADDPALMMCKLNLPLRKKWLSCRRNIWQEK